VPARATVAPRAGPEDLAVLGLARLPQREVGQAVLLVFVGAGTGGLGTAEFEFAFVKVGKGPVFRERRQAEVDRAVRALVGVALFHQGPDHRDLLRDVVGGGRLDVGRQAIQGGAVGMEAPGPATRELGEALPGLDRATDGLVVDVGDVADVPGGQAVEFQHAPQDVLNHEGAEVADVGRAIDGRAAAVESERAAVERAQGTDFAGPGIEKADHAGA